jgi:hypothetical protein
VPVAPAVPPLVPALPVVMTPMQTPFVQVWPLAQAWPQPPQFAMLVLTSTQADPHSVCPATEQPHVPALHAAPAGQVMLQPPQLNGSFPFVVAQVPLEHAVAPVPQLVAQAPLLQTCPVGQVVVQLPQWLLSGEMHEPLQFSRPPRHWQDPPWHI